MMLMPGYADTRLLLSDDATPLAFLMIRCRLRYAMPTRLMLYCLITPYYFVMLRYRYA